MFFQKLKREYIKSIEKLINDLYEEYDIHDRQTKVYINKTELLNKILFRINSECSENQGICSGIFKNGNSCNKKTVDNTNFCKKHLLEIQNEKLLTKYKSQEHSQQIQEHYQEENPDEFEIESQEIKNLKTKFINDAFYYIDDKYIYDKNTYEKVGYIQNKDTTENQFIFTENPFLLGTLL